MRIPRLVLAGAHSGAGKTSVTLALMAALIRRGIAVQAFKVGPDYIDPMFHTRVTGRVSRNLDSWMLPESTVRRLFLKHALYAAEQETPAINVIEGVMGLFDGQGTGHQGSTAHVAELLNAPVILIIDGTGLSRSAAALVRGYRDFSSGCRLAGVIVNRVSARHYALVREIIESETRIPCFGYLPRDGDVTLPERHLGLVPEAELPDCDARIARLADMAGQSLDLTGLLACAGQAGVLQEPPQAPSPPSSRGTALRIGVARDSAFTFYYQDNLDFLEEYGARPVFFSPMNDAALPENLHGLYLGGGFPEVFAHSLAGNTPMRGGILKALETGLPAYAECGGLLYLCASLTDAAGTIWPMCGFFPERAEMAASLQPFGYVEVSVTSLCLLGPVGTGIRAHAFHHSRLVEAEGAHTPRVLHVRKPGGAHWDCGLHKKNVVAAFPHLHFHTNPAVARNFLRSCEHFRTG